MKLLNNNYYKQIRLYSVISKDYLTRKSVCTLDHTPLDNILKSNNLERSVVPGDGNCCFIYMSCLQMGFKRSDKTKA